MRCVVNHIGNKLALGAALLGLPFMAAQSVSAAPVPYVVPYTVHFGSGVVFGNESFGANQSSITGNPNSFSAINGSNSWTFADLLATANPSFSNVSTGASGQLTAFSFDVVNSSNIELFVSFIPGFNVSYAIIDDSTGTILATNGPTPPGNVSVPEPAALGILAVGLVGLVSKRKQASKNV